jgi:transaldolase / glucose-6-phosphate isomerase
MPGRLDVALPAPLRRHCDDALEAWRRDGKTALLWARDAGLWTGGGEASWLGWLDVAAPQDERVEALRRFASEVDDAGFARILLLGMGGSSLGPAVLQATLGAGQGRRPLEILDSTDPAQIAALERRSDPARTLHIVSSKSGTTLETDILMRHFLARAEAALGAGNAGAQFVAITDPASALEAEAKRRRFRRVFLGRPSIGGRFSVLSEFGLAPAAAMGLDVARLLAGAAAMARACRANVDNPGVTLGVVLGVAAMAGRDKATILASPGLAGFGAWLEQLLAESTGKRGRGIVPVDDEPAGATEAYGQDRLFVALGVAGEPDDGQAQRLEALARAGHPVIRIDLDDDDAIGGEFFRWEIATAVAGSIIGIDPFDQPDVEASKAKTRDLIAASGRAGDSALFEDRGIALYADARNAGALAAAARGRSLVAWLGAHFARLGAGDYCALLAFIERSAAHAAALRDIRRTVRDATRAATCVGFGPGFLHSTGQGHKGGPNSGVFLQITCDRARDLPVPGRAYGFGAVIAAQAAGDLAVLAERGRRCLRVHLGHDVAAGLATLRDAVRESLGQP